MCSLENLVGTFLVTILPSSISLKLLGPNIPHAPELGQGFRDWGDYLEDILGMHGCLLNICNRYTVYT